MASLRKEVQVSLYALLERLDRFNDVNPEMPLNDAAADFNLILRTAKVAFPSSGTVQALRPLEPSQPLLALITRLSALKGAVDAAIAAEV